MNETMDKKVAELVHDLTRAIEMIEQLDSALAVTVESRSILLASQACPHCGPNCDLLTEKEFGFHDRLKLKPGDVVRVRDDGGTEGDFLVKAAPWQLGHGAWVIGLKGISGGYSLDRVVKLVSRNPI